MKKRSFKVLLALVMAFSLMLPTSVFADNYDQEAIDKAIAKIYMDEEVVLQGLKVVDADGAPVNESLEFTLFDTTIQEFVKSPKSDGGVLEDTTLIKGHHYILSLANANYEMKDDSKITNKYFTLDATGALPKNDKSKENNDDPNRTTFDKVTVVKRDTPLSDEELKKVNRIPLGISETKTGLGFSEASGTVDGFSWDDDLYISDYDGLKFKLVNQYETLELTPDEFDFLQADLIEDLNYAVVMEADGTDLEGYKLLSNLVTTKNHQERGFAELTRTYTHYTCNPVKNLFVTDAGYDSELFDDCTYAPFKSLSGKSSLDGITAFIVPGLKINRDNQNEFLFNERVLDKTYNKMVVDFDTINMHRDEISKLPYGDYTIKTTIHEGNKVVAVYNVDAAGNKVEDLTFTQDENDLANLEIKTPNVSLYNTVIEFVHEHTIEAVTGTPSTCKDHGVKDHFKCSVCGKLFSDAEGLNEITEDDTVLPLGPHNFKDGKCTVCGASENPGGTGGTGGNGGSDATPEDGAAPSGPDTGDNNSFALWALLVLASVAGLGSVAHAKKKHN